MLNELFRTDEDENSYSQSGLWIVALIAIGMCWYWMHPSSRLEPDGDPKWDAAITQSQTSGQPTVVLFTADWCPACRNLHANALSNDDVTRELAEHHTFITIDLTNPSQADQIRANKFQVRGIPTLIRYNADGKETARTHGLPPDKMLAWLQE